MCSSQLGHFNPIFDSTDISYRISLIRIFRISLIPFHVHTHTLTHAHEANQTHLMPMIRNPYYGYVKHSSTQCICIKFKESLGEKIPSHIKKERKRTSHIPCVCGVEIKFLSEFRLDNIQSFVFEVWTICSSAVCKACFVHHLDDVRCYSVMFSSKKNIMINKNIQAFNVFIEE